MYMRRVIASSLAFLGLEDASAKAKAKSAPMRAGALSADPDSGECYSGSEGHGHGVVTTHIPIHLSCVLSFPPVCVRHADAAFLPVGQPGETRCPSSIRGQVLSLWTSRAPASTSRARSGGLNEFEGAGFGCIHVHVRPHRNLAIACDLGVR